MKNLHNVNTTLPEQIRIVALNFTKAYHYDQCRLKYVRSTKQLWYALGNSDWIIFTPEHYVFWMHPPTTTKMNIEIV